MKVKGLDNKVYNWKLTGHVPLGTDTIRRSSPHMLTREILHKIFPLYAILEEVALPGSGGLTADFVIPQKKIIVEVHGKQHYEFVPYFHVDQMGFIQHKKRDSAKRNWCELNNFLLIELPYNEEANEWESRIRTRTSG
jgi:hypothetical protein